MPKATRRIVWAGILIPFGLTLVMNMQVFEPLYPIVPISPLYLIVLISLGGIACFASGIYSLNKGLASVANESDMNTRRKPDIKIDTADIAKMTTEQLDTLKEIICKVHSDPQD